MTNNNRNMKKHGVSNKITLIGTLVNTDDSVKFFRGTEMTSVSDSDCETADFVCFTLKVSRRSDTSDYLQIIIPTDSVEMMVNMINLVGGERHALIGVVGHIMSYCRPKLELFIFADEINIFRDESSRNISGNKTKLEGYLCKEPVIRNTRENLKGRAIADLFVAVNHNWGTSYIPVIMWGDNALEASKLHKGDKVMFEGRLQSRDYIKRVGGDTYTERVHELSATEYKLLRAAKTDRKEAKLEKAAALS